jgi:hypothetical protein
MEMPETEKGNAEFQAQRSAFLLHEWSQRCAPDRDMIFKELTDNGGFVEVIGRKNFDGWFRDKRITARTREILGTRVVELVKWFLRENTIRKVIFPQELEAFISLYPELLPVDHLRLQRLLFELKFSQGNVEKHPYANKNWKDLFSEWTTFGFVRDRYWCVQACSKYILELTGLHERDAERWHWWQQLALGTRLTSEQTNPFLSLRGVYADEYYFQQTLLFRWSFGDEGKDDERYQRLITLLHSTLQFTQRWERVEEAFYDGVRPLTLLPVPFFRSDGTMLWMLEVSAPLDETEGYQFVARLATDAVTSEYLADVRRRADEEGRYKQNAYFIEDFAHNFAPEERFALGVAP